MNLDSLTGILPPPAIDIKPEKKPETEYPEAIKESAESSDLNLDANGRNLEMQETSKNNIVDGDIEVDVYNAKGVLIRKIPPGYVTHYQQGPISLII